MLCKPFLSFNTGVLITEAALPHEFCTGNLCICRNLSPAELKIVQSLLQQ